jgi:hypothetical protein
MKLLFIILAHDQPEHLAALAATLADAASDGRVVIHFDAGAKPEEYALLKESLKDNQRIAFTERRVRCYWGGYGLVEAVLVALEEARAAGHEYDYVLLLSGSCLPCRPIRQLERYLTENNGREFIEAEGPEWVTDGLREERYTFYTVFRPLSRPLLENVLWEAQHLLGIKRKLPAGIKTVKLGSQWWGLTWRTCLDIIDFMTQNRDIERFYRKTWIPDEMVFPSVVHHLVAPEKITGHNLTHYQFTERSGKPVVFYDDHGDYPFLLKKFFYRKVSGEARALRRRSLELACGPDNGEALGTIGLPNVEYQAKIQTQTYFPVPGQLYYRDQLSGPKDIRSKGRRKRSPGKWPEQTASLLKRITKPYVAVYGSLKPSTVILPTLEPAASVALVQRPVRPDTPLKPMAEPYVILCDSPEAVEATFATLDSAVFEPLGRPFKADEVDFGAGRESFRDLKKTDAAIRDIAPALYFARMIKRCEKIPVFLWMPGDNQIFIDLIAADPRCTLGEVRLW